ncbi:MarR family transcriptional regulator [Streptomyces longwoodensis]|uniref:MarR family winged helix-turn-helix transcriptional regulator n=1 Tax=Streptomyces longwoodensis TaxID=68231 RepID=UPI002DDBD706|nr:MarR family transcriptional regulator [Streptomyces longwoodensis]WRY87827.1 MarR family transcriptional regulator [Streptomyces longwoodensis]WUC74157.1 MarR family transcriptional regulator [Streptomyces longwoodensis]
MVERPERTEPSSGPGHGVAEIRQGVVRLARRLSAERPEDGLSLNKSSVLAHLRRNGPMSAGALAAADHQQPQSLTRVFAELESDGLISRSRDTRDGRQRVLELTDEGRRALARDMAQRDVWLDRALAGLTETEQQVLLLAARLMNRLADSPGGRSDRPSRPR